MTKYPKVADLVAGTTTHLTVPNPAGLSRKGERMYRHIKQRYGRDPRGKEIASRTVLARARTHPELRANAAFDDSEILALKELQRGDPVIVTRDEAGRYPRTSGVVHQIHEDAIEVDVDEDQLDPGLHMFPRALVWLDIQGDDDLRPWDPQVPAGYHEAVRRLLGRGMVANPSPEIRQAAIEKFTQFHRYPPTKITEFGKGFAIPTEVVKAGPARWTTYRSGKVDPATLKKPKRPVDYIHEHNAGVCVYFPVDAPELDDLGLEDRSITKVPRAYFATEALVKLGDSLGFCIRGEGDEDDEFEGAKGEELFCVPDGTCLVIVANRREVVTMIWGGALGVFGRGIDG